MEYNINVKNIENNGTILNFDMILSPAQLNGVVSFLELYSFENIVTKEKEWKKLNNGNSPSSIPEISSDFIISYKNDKINANQIDASTNIYGGHTYNEEPVKYLKEIFTQENINGYEALYRLIKSGSPSLIPYITLPNNQEIEHFVKRGPLRILEYYAFLISEVDLVIKGFNSLQYAREFFQGYISAANWLNLNYNDYILYIFKGPQRLKVSL